MSTTENNNIIIVAEFMELLIEKKLVYIPKYNSGAWKKLSKLKYHSDWNLLMEVVLKCKENQIFGSQHLIDKIDNALVFVDIEAVYNDCVDFIKWYKEQK